MPHRPAVTMRTHEVFAIAHDLADRVGHADVTPSHVLLAMLHEGRSPAIMVLYVLGVHLKKLELEEEMLQRAGIASSRIGHSYIGCEHLLLAFLSDDSSAEAEILARHGVHLATARAAVLRAMGAPPEET